jgi:hypothetical protein
MMIARRRFLVGVVAATAGLALGLDRIGRTAPAAGAVAQIARNAAKLTVDSQQGTGVVWSGDALVDGKSWPVGDGAVVWLPPGPHTLETSSASPGPHVVDFNGDLRSAERTGQSGIELSYECASRAVAMVDRKPSRLDIDGADAPLTFLASGNHFSLLLPRGQHLVTIHTE